MTECTYRLPESLCPECGYKLDAATCVEGDGANPPDPGDVSYCLNCGQVLIYAENLSVRRPTREEIAELTDRWGSP